MNDHPCSPCCTAGFWPTREVSMWGAKSHIPAAHFALVASSCHRQLGCKFVERLALIHPRWLYKVCCNVGRDQLVSAVVAGLWISGGLKKQNCKGSKSNNWHIGYLSVTEVYFIYCHFTKISVCDENVCTHTQKIFLDVSDIFFR